MTRQFIAVVPAAGIGSRMQADKPKQYLDIQGKTILQHTLDVLLSYPKIQRIIVAVAPNDPYIHALNLTDNPKIQLVDGGENRADSVYNGLKHIEETNAWVLVHDAARPCLSHRDLDNLIKVDDENGAILAIPVTDTVKRAVENHRISHTEDRSQLWLAQTPQFFRVDLLKQALENAVLNQYNVTDEASAMEFAGYRPHLISGRSDNIKVTRPEDLALATFYLSKSQS